MSAETVSRAQPHSRWRDFQMIAVGAVLLLLFMALGDLVSLLQPLRVVLGLLFVLFVPGYCLVSACFIRAEDLEGVARIGVSIGLSVAVAPVLALIMDQLPWGIKPWPILIAEFIATGLFMAVAAYRRSRTASEDLYYFTATVQAERAWRATRPRERLVYTGFAVGAILVALLGVWLAFSPSSERYMTEFYVLGNEGLAEDYPLQVAAGQPLTVTTGIVNDEQTSNSYSVEVWLYPSNAPDQRQLVKTEGPFELEPNQKVEQALSWTMPSAAPNQIAEITLKMGKQTEPYRQLRLWLDNKE